MKITQSNANPVILTYSFEIRCMLKQDITMLVSAMIMIMFMSLFNKIRYIFSANYLPITVQTELQ